MLKMKYVRVKYSLNSYSRKLVDLDKQPAWERKVIETKRALNCVKELSFILLNTLTNLLHKFYSKLPRIVSILAVVTFFKLLFSLDLRRFEFRFHDVASKVLIPEIECSE